MRMIYTLSLVGSLLTFAVPVQADEMCGALPDRSAERAGLVAALETSPDALAGQDAANALWRHWTQAPDPLAQRLLDQGMQSIQFGEPDAAVVVLNDLVAYCPDFPEGWNQRAFARFLSGDFDGSLADIEETLAREPAHFGAYAGKVMILVRQNRRGLARLTLIEALKVHPWLQESALLGDEGQSL